jgi:phage shock protein C
MADRLYRSRDERMLAGVAGGLAERFDADPSVIRVLWVIVTILTGGIAFLVYLAMAVIVPEVDGAPSNVANAGPPGSMAPGEAAPLAATGSGWVTPAPRAARPRRQGDGGRRGAIVLGVILVLVGAYLLVRELAPSVDLALLWPVASVVLGVVLVILSVRPKRSV